MKCPLPNNGRLLLEKRYLKKDASGRPVEAPEDMFVRVARNIASAEGCYPGARPTEPVAEEFARAMLSLDFLPNSPALMNAGRQLLQPAACFVLDVEDSIEAIFETLKDAAGIHQSGGGTGFSFSRVRPRGDYVSTSGGQATDPLSFMRIFDQATEAINQGGFRRGANMVVLRADHPDILEFIAGKEQEGELANFNISVALTNAFMEALEEGGVYPLINPRTGGTARELSASHVFGMIVQNAWANGEPGVVLIDRINEHNPTPAVGAISATNPCGEAPLLPFESCVLGSINLAHVLTGSPPECSVDWDKLGRLGRMGVRFLDDMITVTRFPPPQIEPIFAVVFERHVLDGPPLKEVQPDFLPLCAQEGLDVGENLMAQVLKHGNGQASGGVAAARAPAVRHGSRGAARTAPRGAGRVPEAHRQHRVEDSELAGRQYAGGRARRLPEGL